MVRGRLRNRLGHKLHLPTDQVDKRRRAAPVRDMHHKQPGGVLEHLGHQVRDAAIASRTVVDLARVFGGVVTKFLQRLGGHVVVHQQCQRLLCGAGDGHKVFQGVVGQLVVERTVDHHHPGVGQHDGVAIRRAPRHRLGPHRAACTGFVVHDERLAQHGLQFVGQQPGMLVQRATGGETHHNFDGFFGVSGRYVGAGSYQQCSNKGWDTHAGVLDVEKRAWYPAHSTQDGVTFPRAKGV